MWFRNIQNMIHGTRNIERSLSESKFITLELIFLRITYNGQGDTTRLKDLICSNETNINKWKMYHHSGRFNDGLKNNSKYRELALRDNS